MQELNNFIGFRNLDKDSGTISRAMESQKLFDYQPPTLGGVVALQVVDPSVEDIEIVKTATSLPEGQTLWAFSSNYRKIDHPRVRVTHVRASTQREFDLKVSHHLGKFVLGLPEGTPLTPKRLPFPESVVTVNESEQYLPKPGQREVVRKIVDGVPFEFFADIKRDSQKLVVFGQSALTRSKVTLPYFFRWTWSHRIDASVIIWNDPTLYLADDIDAGWWIGSLERDYIEEGAEIVRAIAQQLNIANDNIVFVGLSAGGMSAIPMATHLVGSHAVVENPRVTMFADGARGKMADLAIQRCWGYQNAQIVPDDLKYRLDAFKRIKEKGILPKITYLQNVLDAAHMDDHYLYFKDLVMSHQEYDQSRHVFIEYEQWSLLRGGHFPLKESVMVRIINEIISGGTIDCSRLSREEITRD